MIEFDQYVIMSKDRKWIACGTPRNRELRLIEDLGNIRILTYKSKGVAESGFKNHWFSTYNHNRGENGHIEPPKENDLEAVKMKVTYNEVE